MACTALKILLVTLVLSYGLTCTHGCECLDDILPNVLPEVSDKVLFGSSYTEITTDSLARCGVRCMRQKRCRSFNHDARSGTCYLNDNSHHTLPDRMFVRPTVAWTYYFVGQWDQSFLGECAHHECEDDEICVGRAGQSVPKYACMSTYSADILCRQSSCAECQPEREYNQRPFTSLGCYPSGHTNVLPSYLSNLRGGTIVWDDLSSFETVLQECADAAQGYELFGIEYFGECYAGNYSNSPLPNEVDVSECESKCLYGDVGVGHNDVMFVYRWSG